jgi:hypothetical protein
MMLRTKQRWWDENDATVDANHRRWLYMLNCAFGTCKGATARNFFKIVPRTFYIKKGVWGRPRYNPTITGQ